MDFTRRTALGSMAGALMAQKTDSKVTRYVRYQSGSTTSYGILQGEDIQPLSGDLFGNHRATGSLVKLSQVKLVYPGTPPKVIAVGLNYKSHLGNRPAPKRPEIFYKPISSLQDPGAPIVIPEGAKNVHYEGELVLVIGKRLKSASVDEARAGIFGVTCGNDVSERDWQNGADKDLQWWRAKGADTFGPMGPCIARGLDYGKLQLRTKLNGEVVQEQNTSDLLFDGPAIVSWVSKHVSLEPGDVIYTGTPGATRAMKPGDVVEVEIEGIGTLRNTVKSA